MTKIKSKALCNSCQSKCSSSHQRTKAETIQ